MEIWTAGFSSDLGQIRQSDKIQDERRCKEGIIALPEELERHFGSKKSPEMDEIPCCFLI